MAQSKRDVESAGGRPRDQNISDAVLLATQRILDDEGYFGVSLEGVARQAGTSRPAIYRRWSGRAALVLATVAARLDVPRSPDTGCTLCDIGDSFALFLSAYRAIRPEVLSALYAECAADPALREQYLQTIVEPARSAVAHTLDRAVERGDLRADTDRALLLDMVGALVAYRAMLGRDQLSPEEATHAIQILLQGAALDYAALLAHNQALTMAHSHPHPPESNDACRPR